MKKYNINLLIPCILMLIVTACNGGGDGGVEGSGSSNQSPTAGFTASAIYGEPPLTVNFDGTGTDSDGSVVAYHWNFGDGGTSTNEDVSHAFNTAGNFLVKLTVTDDKGATGSYTLSIACGSSDFPYVINNTTFYPTPSMARPAKGVPFVDPVFNTTITRITDSPTDVPGNSYNYAQPGYPKHNIENADGTMLIIQAYSGSSWFIWNANPPYNKIQEIPSSQISWGAEADCRWSATDPDILYYYRETRFYKYSVSGNTSTLLRDFASDFPSLSFSRITMYEEGSPSDDTRYWCFALRSSSRDEGYVVYDKDYHSKDNGEIVGTMFRDDPLWLPSSASDSTPNSYANYVGMSPSGDYAVITSWGARSAIFSRDLSSKTHTSDFLRTSIVSYGHNDVGYDADGNEVIVFGNSSGGSFKFGMVNIVTGEVTWLAVAGANDYHISTNHPGWAVMSNYYPKYPDSRTKWGEHEVYLIELTRRTSPAPKVWRIAHTHTVRKAYADDPFAKMDRSGTKVWFGSGWGGSYQDTQYDVYQIDLPPTWKQDLSE